MADLTGQHPIAVVAAHLLRAAVINVAIGWAFATVTGDCYEWDDALSDAAWGTLTTGGTGLSIGFGLVKRQTSGRAIKAGKEAAKAAKQLERKIKTAKKALRTNKDFRRYFHQEYKARVKIPGANRRNPDLGGEEILEAFEEWLALGGK